MFINPYTKCLKDSGKGIKEEPFIGVYLTILICISNRRDIAQLLLLQVIFLYFSL